MTPVSQQRIDSEGDCFPACLASILEVPLEEVPHPGREAFVNHLAYGQYLESLNDQWLRRRGFYLQVLPGEYLVNGKRSVPQGYAIATIQKEGRHHAVVMYNGHPIWDPSMKHGCYENPIARYPKPAPFTVIWWGVLVPYNPVQRGEDAKRVEC